jgi:hypothetical protein
MKPTEKIYSKKLGRESKRGPTAPAPVSPVMEITDAGGMNQLFTLRKGTLYNLCENVPELKNATFSLAREGQKRGKRLFLVEPFRRYFQSNRES